MEIEMVHMYEVTRLLNKAIHFRRFGAPIMESSKPLSPALIEAYGIPESHPRYPYVSIHRLYFYNRMDRPKQGHETGSIEKYYPANKTEDTRPLVLMTGGDCRGETYWWEMWESEKEEQALECVRGMFSAMYNVSSQLDQASLGANKEVNEIRAEEIAAEKWEAMKTRRRLRRRERRRKRAARRQAEREQLQTQ